MHLDLVSGLDRVEEVVAQQVHGDDALAEPVVSHEDPAGGERVDVIGEEHGLGGEAEEAPAALVGRTWPFHAKSPMLTRLGIQMPNADLPVSHATHLVPYVRHIMRDL